MKHNIDFDFYTRGVTDTLIVIDTSEYFERPSNVIIEVQFPNFTKSYSSYFNPKDLNVLTTNSLGWSPNKIDFPDGLYQIKLSVSPNESVFKCKNYMKTDKLKSRLNEMLQADVCTDIKKITYLYDVDKFLTLAQAMENSSPSKSIEAYNVALKLINKLECNV